MTFSHLKILRNLRKRPEIPIKLSTFYSTFLKIGQYSAKYLRASHQSHCIYSPWVGRYVIHYCHGLKMIMLYMLYIIHTYNQRFMNWLLCMLYDISIQSYCCDSSTCVHGGHFYYKCSECCDCMVTAVTMVTVYHIWSDHGHCNHDSISIPEIPANSSN